MILNHDDTILHSLCLKKSFLGRSKQEPITCWNIVFAEYKTQYIPSMIGWLTKSPFRNMIPEEEGVCLDLD